MHRLIAIAALIIISALGWNASAWETAERPNQQAERQQVDADAPEIAVRDGWIYVTTSRPITIKIFSILGQLISQDTLPAGSFKMHVQARGIYILKAGTTTRRITI